MKEHLLELHLALLIISLQSEDFFTGAWWTLALFQSCNQLTLPVVESVDLFEQEDDSEVSGGNFNASDSFEFCELPVELLDGAVWSLEGCVDGHAWLFGAGWLELGVFAFKFLEVVLCADKMANDFDSFSVDIGTLLVESVDFFQEDDGSQVFGGPLAFKLLLKLGWQGAWCWLTFEFVDSWLVGDCFGSQSGKLNVDVGDFSLVLENLLVVENWESVDFSVELLVLLTEVHDFLFNFSRDCCLLLSSFNLKDVSFRVGQESSHFVQNKVESVNFFKQNDRSELKLTVFQDQWFVLGVLTFFAQFSLKPLVLIG